MNTRLKMYDTNVAIKKELVKRGFHSIYLFPHLRFIKDYHLDGLGFDAIAFKFNDKRLFLMQFKTNEKPSKRILQEYEEIGKKYYCCCLWATKIKRKGVEIYGNLNTD